MDKGLVVYLSHSPEQPSPGFICAEFGWSFQTVSHLSALRELSATLKVVAVLFEPGVLNLPPQDALEKVKAIAPGAYLVPCCGVSDAIDWPALAAAGAFHSLQLPLQESEVRQTIGFLWAAERKRMNAAALGVASSGLTRRAGRAA